jgi:hypothetical protein
LKGMRVTMAIAIGLMMCLTGLIVLPENANAMAPQQWESKTALNNNAGLGAVVTATGDQIYRFGGWSALWTLSNQSVLYDIQTGSSTNLTPLPKALDFMTAVYYMGTIFVAGGRDSGSESMDTLYQYDIYHNTWAIRANMLKGVSQSTGAMDDSGRLWIVGGYNSTDIAPTAQVQIFDPATNSWSSGTPLPAAMHSGVGFKANGQFYVVGGIDAASNVLSTVLAIPMNGGAWTAKTSMPVANAWMSVALGEDNQAYVIGGSQSSGGSFNQALNTTFIYNPDTNSWRSGPVLPERVMASSAVATSDGRVWRLGGGLPNAAMSRNVSALTVMTVTESIYPSVAIGTGRDIMVNVTVDLAFRSMAYMRGTAVIIGSDGSAYGNLDYNSGTSSMIHIVLTVPQLAPAGSYRVTFVDTHVYDSNGFSFTIALSNVSFSVVSMPSAQDQIGSLNEQLVMLRDEMNTTQGQLALSWATGNATQAQVTVLQGQITTVQTALSNTQASLAQAQLDIRSGNDSANAKSNLTQAQMAAMQAQIVALQTQLNASQSQLTALQTSSSDLKTSVSSKADGTVALMTMIFALVAVILIALMLVVVLKKK